MSDKPERVFAFPFNETHNFPWGSEGMLLRDYFAAAALSGMFAADTSEGIIETDKKAQFAYEAADALLKQRNKTE